MPRFEPMLATRATSIARSEQWAYEMKWDGVRAILSCDGSSTQLRSRRGNDVTAAYPEIRLSEGVEPVVLDGEIVALDDEGRPSFGRLQGRMNLQHAGQIQAAVDDIAVTYVVFDIPYLRRDITAEPWSERRRRLEQLDLPAPCVVSAVVDDPAPLWDFVVARNIEGIVAKRRASTYQPGVRSPDWLKKSVTRTVRAVVGGFTTGEGRRHHRFGALVLGLWEGDALRWVGSVGTGFDDRSLVAIRNALEEMVVDRSPFVPDPAMPRGVTWVSPQLVALVEFKEWTGAGRLRAPSFKGFTDDPVETVTWQAEGPGT